ncbi:hypothetical protein AAG570_003298 [Ranatra chinensis]|uniref:Uncharacterized protein n=1 Tax=Ranatra chinensis TaxID=642074 RepID=A0ABD0Y8H8_9HEMI
MILKPTWTYGIELWGSASPNRFQSIATFSGAVWDVADNRFGPMNSQTRDDRPRDNSEVKVDEGVIVLRMKPAPPSSRVGGVHSTQDVGGTGPDPFPHRHIKETLAPRLVREVTPGLLWINSQEASPTERFFHRINHAFDFVQSITFTNDTVSIDSAAGVRSAESSGMGRVVMKGGSDVSLPLLEESSGGVHILDSRGRSADSVPTDNPLSLRPRIYSGRLSTSKRTIDLVSQ